MLDFKKNLLNLFKRKKENETVSIVLFTTSSPNISCNLEEQALILSIYKIIH